MPTLTIDASNRGAITQALDDGDWVVACLCAAWCGTCASYRASFDAVAQRHPGKLFAWIDIEDQADFVGELDVDNFPTLLIQRGGTVAFFGTMLPDSALADRLVAATAELPDEELKRLANSSPERREWQAQCNLLTLAGAAGE